LNQLLDRAARFVGEVLFVNSYEAFTPLQRVSGIVRYPPLRIFHSHIFVISFPALCADAIVEQLRKKNSPGATIEKLRLRSLDALQWGLIPHWAKDPKIAYRTINARAETVDKAPSFRQAFRKRRCLIPAER
jgi:SOS response associated peptidase (SRAP)